MSKETIVIHSVEILDQMDESHFALADMGDDNEIGSIPEDEDEPFLAAVVLLLGMVRKLKSGYALVLRKEEESNG